jgi:hypothetical protein
VTLKDCDRAGCGLFNISACAVEDFDSVLLELHNGRHSDEQPAKRVLRRVFYSAGGLAGVLKSPRKGAHTRG